MLELKQTIIERQHQFEELVESVRGLMCVMWMDGLMIYDSKIPIYLVVVINWETSNSSDIAVVH